MVMSLVRESEGKPYIAMEPEISAATDSLRSFLFERVYLNPLAKSEESKAQDMLMFLFEYYVKHP